jgi:AbrB family looped-hinge helix DNA binding protein
MGSSSHGGRSGKNAFRLAENFFGTATVGERGQIVIPSEARKKLQIETGDKLLVIGHGEKGIMLVKIEAMREFITSMMEDLRMVETKYHQQDENLDNSQEETA